MRILVSIRIHHALLKYILMFTSPFITFSIDLGNYPLRMGVSVEEYRQRIGCFVRVLSSFKVRGNNNTYQRQSKDFGTALQVIIRCVDYAIKKSIIVIINTGYNNHAGYLHILVQ